jgi:hypothetical protein
MDPSPTRKGIPLLPELPRDSQTGAVFENPRDTKGRDRKGSPRRVCGLTKECPVLDASESDHGDESWPVMGLVRIGVPPGLVGRRDPSHGTKCRSQSDHTERSDLAKRFFIARWERERAKWGGGRGLNTPQ